MLLREEVRTRAEIDAGAAHARASATLLLAVPVLFGGVSLLLIPGAHAQVLGHPAALAAVVLGAVLEVVGVLWSARLVRAVRGCDW